MTKEVYAKCKMGFNCKECGLICMCGFNSNPPCALTLTPTLATHYQQRSQDTGKSVNALVLADLTALLKKRVAREEKRVWREIEFERL